jgi:hypothetical protein
MRIFTLSSLLPSKAILEHNWPNWTSCSQRGLEWLEAYKDTTRPIKNQYSSNASNITYDQIWRICYGLSYQLVIALNSLKAGMFWPHCHSWNAHQKLQLSVQCYVPHSPVLPPEKQVWSRATLGKNVLTPFLECSILLWWNASNLIGNNTQQ